MWVLTCLTRLNLLAEIYNKDALRSPVLRQLCSPQAAHQRFVIGLKGPAKTGCGWMAWLRCSSWTTVLQVSVFYPREWGHELGKAAEQGACDWCHGPVYPDGMKVLCLHGCHAIQSNPQTQRAWWGLLVITNQNNSSNVTSVSTAALSRAPGCFTEQEREGGSRDYSRLSLHKAEPSWPKGIARKR